MIRLSNGHSFEFMTASGALAFDGRGWPWEWPLRWFGLLDPALFTIVIKTVTRHPRRGNLRWSHPWSVVKKIGVDGAVNAIGLTNPGIDRWRQEVAPKIPHDYNLIVSLEADNSQELGEMLKQVEGLSLRGVELNLSCPNSTAGRGADTEKIVSLCAGAKKRTRLPLIAKLSVTHDYVTIAKRLEGTVEAIAINSIPWKVIYPDRRSPLERFGDGGVSGRVVQSFTWKMVKELSIASSIPVIGPSVWEFQDIQKIFDLGARAVSFGSIFLRYPWRPTLYVRRWKRKK